MVTLQPMSLRATDGSQDSGDADFVIHLDHELQLALIQVMVADRLSSEGKFEEALAAVQHHTELMADDAAARECSVVVYDVWAKSFLEREQWEEALQVYGKALERFPGERHLRQNAVAVWNQWGKSFIDKGQWEEAIAIYERALKSFPTDGTLKNNLKYCKQQQQQK